MVDSKHSIPSRIYLVVPRVLLALNHVLAGGLVTICFLSLVLVGAMLGFSQANMLECAIAGVYVSIASLECALGYCRSYLKESINT